MPMLISGRSPLSKTLLGDSVTFSKILLMWMNQNDDRAECLGIRFSCLTGRQAWGEI